MKDFIEIHNATIHNLKGIDVKIPKHKLTVITGVSGSGKSSLAFDLLYEEGKRRYLMFSGTQLAVDNVPGFDSVSGLSPTVAVEQRTIRQSNPRSTVGTRTKLSALLAALFANFGVPPSGTPAASPLEISMFQKNSPKGMCVKCMGKGIYQWLDEEALFADTDQRLDELCLGLGKRGQYKHLLGGFCENYGLHPHESRLRDLTEEQRTHLLYGDGGSSRFLGFVPWVEQNMKGAFSTSGRLAHLLTEAGFIQEIPCPKCGGSGLGEQASGTTLGGKTITELEGMYIRDLRDFMAACADSSNPLVKEIITKLNCMTDVGLHHLSLSRPLPTLSGGEIQRLFLASYMIAEMDSIIFIFDEPTIGLHEVEKQRLIDSVCRLIEMGNTVVAVEHDENFIRRADYLIDLGPDAGIHGGYKVYEGGYGEFLSCGGSRTAPYLANQARFPVKTGYRPVDASRMLTLKGAHVHNLKNVSVGIPLGVMVGIAGVSGSGKSSLISDTLVPKLKEQLQSDCISEEGDTVFTDATLTGTGTISRCYIMDQQPIGRTRTSCPATYTGILSRVRKLFAATEAARERGYDAGLFSVNSKGGCKKCKGDGVIHYHVGFGNFIEMDCEACGGTGYVPEALEVTLDGKNICEVLKLTVDEAAVYFEGKDKTVSTILKVLQRVGMGYIKLGQATPTISGGESQRIKLAKELAHTKKKDSLYILDEPTTGLSFRDSERLLELMNELTDNGNSIIVTEHDPYILSNCDYVIELGPGGGREGGRVIARGTPAELKADPNSLIGRYLK